MVTGEYDLVLRSEVDYSDEDIDFMEYAGLSDKDIEDITSTQIVIPENSDKAKQIDYELTYYVNDINTANTQVLMTYGRNDTEKDVYTYGVDRIVHDDLQRDKASDYVYDGRGSVVQTVSDGEVDLSITYDPYGDITDGVDENFVGYAYNGEESNEVTGLQYLRARYYNTEIGSFISIDSYLGSITEPISQNRYTYANNNPVNNIDPTGHYSQGIDKYYQSTGLNELRDQMVAASFHAGEVEAQNAFNRQVSRAQNTSMFNYNSINGISQDTANAYIANGIVKAAETSMNYGCDTPKLSNEAVSKFATSVQNSKTSANQKIQNIKVSKQAQYRAYQIEQQRQQRLREAIAETLRKLQKMQDLINAGFVTVKNSNSLVSIPRTGDDIDYKEISDNMWYASEGISWFGDISEVVSRIYNKWKYNFNVTLDGAYAKVKGARSVAALDQGIKGTRYALKNASQHLNVFKYVDPGSAAKEALDFGKNKLGYLSVALDTLSGVVENVGEGASVQETIVDGAVDTTFGIGNIVASAAAGAAAGSVVPGAGTVAGAFVGIGTSILFDGVTDDFKIFGDESIKDKVKNGANDLVDWIRKK